MAFQPKVDHQLTVDLPGERALTTVRKVVSRDMVIVELTSTPLAKSHTYKLRELVPVRRTQGMLGETWQAVSEHELRVAQANIAKKAAKAPHAAIRFKNVRNATVKGLTVSSKKGAKRAATRR